MNRENQRFGAWHPSAPTALDVAARSALREELRQRSDAAARAEHEHAAFVAQHALAGLCFRVRLGALAARSDPGARRYVGGAKPRTGAGCSSAAGLATCAACTRLIELRGGSAGLVLVRLLR